MSNKTTYYKKVQHYLKENNYTQIVNNITFKMSTIQSKITTHAAMQENVTHKQELVNRNKHWNEKHDGISRYKHYNSYCIYAQTCKEKVSA